MSLVTPLISTAAIDRRRTSALESVDAYVQMVMSRELNLRDDMGGTCFFHCSYAEKRLYWVMKRLKQNALWPTQVLYCSSLTNAIAHMCASSREMVDAVSEEDELFPACSNTDCMRGDCDGVSMLGTEIGDRAIIVRRNITAVCYTCACEGRQFDDDCDHAVNAALKT